MTTDEVEIHTRAVISDTHGDINNMIDLLLNIGAIMQAGTSYEKVPGVHLTHIGDGPHLANWEQRDYRLVNFLFEYFDVVLLGNHEMSVIDEHHNFPNSETRCPHATQLVRRMIMNGSYKAATSIGEWLITHAGLHPSYHNGRTDAKKLSEWLNTRFKDRLETNERRPVFDDICTYRGGSSYTPGIFWMDFEVLKDSYKIFKSLQPVKQIVGHTPQRKDGEPFIGRAPSLYCIDVGAGLTGDVGAVLTHDDGQTWETVVHRGAPRAGTA